MKNIVIGLMALLTFDLAISLKQETQKPKCPTMLRIEAPQIEHETWTIKAIVEGFDTTQVSYQWTVYIGHDKAQVDSGQGTEMITIKRVDEWPKKGVTVVVDVGGLPEDCAKRATWSIIS